MATDELITPSQMQKEMLAMFRAAKAKLRVDPPSFQEYAEASTGWKLDPWQEHLCARLAQLGHQKGQKLLISAPPQWGKSVWVSQRFPAWMLGMWPELRIRLVTYNLDRSIKFAKTILGLMRDPLFEKYFPHVRLPSVLSQEEWSTPQREALLDSQSSFKALGIATGFVSTGVDLFLMDDPYASPQAAYSQVERDNVWTFYNDGARVRIPEDANQVVTFHRWHQDDIAGRLMEEGGWEVLNYSAVCDDPEGDIMGRQEGEILSPRFTKEYIEAQRSISPSTFESLFQGRPTAKGGGTLERAWFRIIDPKDVPKNLRMGAGIDPAVSGKKTADYSVCLPGGLDEKGNAYLFRPYRDRAEWGVTRKKIVERVLSSGARLVGIEVVAAQKVMYLDLSDELARHMVGCQPVPSSLDKKARASFWAPIAEQGRIHLVDDGSGWVETFLREAEAFDKGKNDDLIDAATVLFTVLGMRSVFEPLKVADRFVSEDSEDEDWAEENAFAHLGF